jgi:hypothetical protein
MLGFAALNSIASMRRISMLPGELSQVLSHGHGCRV